MEADTVSTSHTIAVAVNGQTFEREVEARKLLIRRLQPGSYLEPPAVAQ